MSKMHPWEEAKARIEAQAAEIEKLEKAIKVQASAVRTLQANEETEINVLRQQKREWHQAVSSLDSEREANAILTAENEQLRVALSLALEYWAHRQQRYKNRWPVWVQKARAALGETK